MGNYPTYNNYPDIGITGEDLVVQWLQSSSWAILHRRWRYRGGEIDIIAEYGGHTLAFVEVKTRSLGNWDIGGRNAITQKKQEKIWRTALMFLAEYPQKAEFSCQFDVAIVCYQQISKELRIIKPTQEALACSAVKGYQFTLQEYIPAAFDAPKSW